MKASFKFLICLSLLYPTTAFGQSSIEGIVGKTYSIGDSSLVIRSLSFVNDSICHYKHKFFIDIDPAYRECLIVCKYKTENSKIIISSLTYPDYLKGKLQASIPNYWSMIESYLEADSVELYSKHSNLSKRHTLFLLDLIRLKYSVNGYIDNPINDTLFWFGNCLLYNKYIEVNSISSPSSYYGFYHKFILTDKEHTLSLDQKRDILLSDEANSVVNGLSAIGQKGFQTHLYHHRREQASGSAKTKSDNDVVCKNYKRLQRLFRKLKINTKEQQSYLYDCFLFYNLN